MQKPSQALVLSRNIGDENALHANAMPSGSRRHDLQFWNARERIRQVEIRFGWQRKEFGAGGFDAGAKRRSRVDGDVVVFGHQNPRYREHWIQVAVHRHRSDKNLHRIHPPNCRARRGSWRRGCFDCERGWGDPVTSRLQASRKWLQLQRVIALPTHLRAAAWTVDGKACRSEESEARFALLDFYNIAVGIAHVAARLAALVHWLGNKLRSSTSPEFIGRLNIGNAENHKAAD